MRRVSGVIAIVGQLALWALLLSFLALVALSRLTSYDVLVVRGGSMEPAIHLGSIVIVDRASGSPAIGEITAFRDSTSGVVTHRVVGIKNGLFVTRGDANRNVDTTRRPADSVYGVVVASIPLAGFVIHVLQQPAAFLLLLLGSGGLLVLGAVRTIHLELVRIIRGRGVPNAD